MNMSDIKVEYNFPESVKVPYFNITDDQMRAFKPWIDMVLNPELQNSTPNYTVSIRELFGAFEFPESEYEKHKDFLDYQCYPIAGPNQPDNSEILEYTFEFKAVKNEI